MVNLVDFETRAMDLFENHPEAFNHQHDEVCKMLHIMNRIKKEVVKTNDSLLAAIEHIKEEFDGDLIPSLYFESIREAEPKHLPVWRRANGSIVVGKAKGFYVRWYVIRNEEKWATYGLKASETKAMREYALDHPFFKEMATDFFLDIDKRSTDYRALHPRKD